MMVYQIHQNVHLKMVGPPVLMAHTYTLSTHGARSGGSQFEASLGKQFVRLHLENTQHTHTQKKRRKKEKTQHYKRPAE
jgi:hypothetical protein